MPWLHALFDSQNFMPHGHCFLWYPPILWLHIVSDAFIALAYYSLPVALFYFARKRPDMPFRHLFVLFGLFISLCGTTHLFGIWVLWHADYGPEGLIKASTALVSMATAIILWKAMPQILMLPSPAQLQRMNEELKFTYAQIEEKVAIRTAELAETNQQLQDVSAAAEKASQAKSEFLANMSHEIRTPMNAVVGLTAILSMTELNDKQKKYVETMQFSAESLLSLINNLLDISKIESDEISVERSAYNLERLVNEVVAILSVKAREKSIHFLVDFDDALKGPIMGDEIKLRQVLMNLTSNAIKFTETGSVTLRIALEKVGNALRTVFTVSDTGIGIPDDKQLTIFSKFSQADTSITRKYGGTGLGLAITRKLVELMGGTIGLESTPGSGSTFTVTFPYAPQPTAEAPSVVAKPLALQPMARSLRVLLVEDQPPNVLVASTILEQMGHDVTVAGNGQVALDMLATQSFELVLMDMQMPVLDGYNATLEIRRREREAGGPHVPIIAVTAHALTGDRDKCFAAGVDDYLPKPISIEALQRKITKLTA